MCVDQSEALRWSETIKTEISFSLFSVYMNFWQNGPFPAPTSFILIPFEQIFTQYKIVDFSGIRARVVEQTDILLL